MFAGGGKYKRVIFMESSNKVHEGIFLFLTLKINALFCHHEVVNDNIHFLIAN